MKKLVFALMGFIATEASAFHWVKVFQSEDISFYIHKPAVKHEGTKITVGTLTNYHSAQTTPEGATYRSIKALETFDCLNKAVQTQSASLMSGRMGKGLEVRTPDLHWRTNHVALDSAAHDLWNYLCAQ